MKRFLIQHIKHKNQVDAPITHTAFNGGSYSIPDHKIKNLINLYVDEISESNTPPLYLNECITRNVKFYMDIDMKVDRSIFDLEDREKMMDRLIGNTLFILEPIIGKSNCVVLSSPLKQIDDKFVKWGIHIIFPNIKTTPFTALVLSRVVSTYLDIIKLFGLDKWKSDIIDEGVYKNGLRPIYSYKWDKCKICKNSSVKKIACMDCEGEGGNHVDRQYTLFSAYNGHHYGRICEDYCNEYCGLVGIIEDGSNCMSNLAHRDKQMNELYKEDIHKLVSDTFIRNVDTNTEPFIFDRIKLPKFYYFDSEISKFFAHCEKHSLLHVNEVEFSKHLPAIVSQDKCGSMEEFIMPNNKIFDIILKLIRRFKNYNEGVHIRNIKMRKTKTGKITYFANTEETYCENLMKKHNNATVYFVISSKHIRQRCHCRCNTIAGRVSGVTCGKFWGEPHKIPPNVINVLFPRDDTTTQLDITGAKINFKSPLMSKMTINTQFELYTNMIRHIKAQIVNK